MHVPESVGCHGASIRLLRAAATAPAAGPLDLARVAVRPELVNEFNPFLSPEAAQELQRRVRLWLRLCVLEDRLGRIVALAAARRAEGDCLPQLVQVRRGDGLMCSNLVLHDINVFYANPLVCRS